MSVFVYHSAPVLSPLRNCDTMPCRRRALVRSNEVSIGRMIRWLNSRANHLPRLGRNEALPSETSMVE